MKNVSDKSCRVNQNTHFFSITYFRKSCLYETMWKSVVERNRPQMTIWLMRIACWITSAKNTHPEYVILIAFPLQQRLHEHASMSRYAYIACLVYSYMFGSFVMISYFNTNYSNILCHRDRNCSRVNMLLIQGYSVGIVRSRTKATEFSLVYTGLFISLSGISELDCATTKTDTAERNISIGRESLQVFFVLGALAYFQDPPLGGSREEKWRSQ